MILEESISYDIKNNFFSVFCKPEIVPGIWWFSKNTDAASLHFYVFSFRKRLYFAGHLIFWCRRPFKGTLYLKVLKKI